MSANVYFISKNSSSPLTAENLPFAYKFLYYQGEKAKEVLLVSDLQDDTLSIHLDLEERAHQLGLIPKNFKRKGAGEILGAAKKILSWSSVGFELDTLKPVQTRILEILKSIDESFMD